MDTFFVNPSHGERFEKLFYCGGHLVGAAIIGNLSHMESLKKKSSERRPPDDISQSNYPRQVHQISCHESVLSESG